MFGRADAQTDLFDSMTSFCDERLTGRSIYSFLRRERERLFPDEAFADLFDMRGRYSVPPSVVAVVMVLQRLAGLSDREAVERFTFDARWRYACGMGYGTAWPTFAHTVLVDMRERLRRSERPDRIFEAALGAANEAGLLGRRRVLDSTPLYDAVTTMDTITLIRSAIRGLLQAAGPALEAQLRTVLRSEDDYADMAKPQIDWDDRGERDALIDSRAKDGYACLLLLDGQSIQPEVGKAARLLARLLDQDIEESPDGMLRIARRVSHDRVISTVDQEARHGHKTETRGFDGYKGHVAMDPDSEIITAAAVTPGNIADSAVAEGLVGDLVALQKNRVEAGADASSAGDSAQPDRGGEAASDEQEDRVVAYGDTQYGTAEFQAFLESTGIDSRCKAQRSVRPDGLYPKDQFLIDLERQAVTCPNGVSVAIYPDRAGGGVAYFGRHCTGCPLAPHCTRSRTGRAIRINRFEGALARARARQADPEWRADYRAIRPKVERKVAHVVRRRHGGRRARVRGRSRVEADFKLLAAAVNCARLAVMGVLWTGRDWSLGMPDGTCGTSRHVVSGHLSRGIRRFSEWWARMSRAMRSRPAHFSSAMTAYPPSLRHFTPAI